MSKEVCVHWIWFEHTMWRVLWQTRCSDVLPVKYNFTLPVDLNSLLNLICAFVKCRFSYTLKNSYPKPHIKWYNFVMQVLSVNAGTTKHRWQWENKTFNAYQSWFQDSLDHSEFWIWCSSFRKWCWRLSNYRTPWFHNICQNTPALRISAVILLIRFG